VLVPPFQGSTFILSCFPRVPLRSTLGFAVLRFQRSILFRLIRMPITTLKSIFSQGLRDGFLISQFCPALKNPDKSSRPLRGLQLDLTTDILP
jgi:hypothetical protein